MNKFVNPKAMHQNKYGAGQAKYFNAFNLINGIGPISFKKLLAHFKSLKTAWSSPIQEFFKAGLNSSLARQINQERLKIDPDLEMEKLEKERVGLITLLDKDYPCLLKEIYNPPVLLYIRGSFKPQDKLSLGIVGTRKLSAYGQRITPLISKDLVQNKITIVSGLAKGIDTLAHQSALKANGRTIAVLGSGIDRQSVYPFNNKKLADQIAENGALISEFPIYTKPLAQNFPMRNRIIAGLSRGILVIEAPAKSGALITAKDGLEQNRDIFAIPGSVFSNNSLGPNNLIKMGAKLVNNANDILEELNLE